MNILEVPYWKERDHTIVKLMLTEMDFGDMEFSRIEKWIEEALAEIGYDSFIMKER